MIVVAFVLRLTILRIRPPRWRLPVPIHVTGVAPFRLSVGYFFDVVIGHGSSGGGGSGTPSGWFSAIAKVPSVFASRPVSSSIGGG